MADIKQRIKNIKEYFQEMQITQVDGTPVIYVIVRFPERWVIDEDIEEKFNVTVGQQSATEYYFCADIETGETPIFDAIEYNISRMKEALERATLLGTKISELRDLFGDENISLDALRTLEFVYKGKRKKAIIPKSIEETAAIEKEESYIEAPSENNIETETLS